MGNQKKRIGRPRTNPAGAVVWSVRVSVQERKALKEYLDKLRKGKQ